MILEGLFNLTDSVRKWSKNKNLDFLRLLLLQMCIPRQVALIRNKLDLNIIVRSLDGLFGMTVIIVQVMLWERELVIHQCVNSESYNLYPGLSCHVNNLHIFMQTSSKVYKSCVNAVLRRYNFITWRCNPFKVSIGVPAVLFVPLPAWKLLA